MKKWLVNLTYDELKIGQAASLTRRITRKDIHAFALTTQDINPIHLDPVFAKQSRFGRIIAHGYLSASLISAVLGTKLPGPGTLYLGQTLHFLKPVYLNDTIKATLTVIRKFKRHRIIELECQCTNQKKEIVLKGRARVMVSQQKFCVQIPKVEKLHLIRRS